MLLTPYMKVRYHLKENRAAAEKPENAKELFNLRHASLRNAIERVFGVVKNRFKIWDSPRKGYSMKTQVKLVYALTALHNFMNWKGDDPVAIAEQIEKDERARDGINELKRDEEEVYIINSAEEVNARQDVIAEMMWQSYLEHRRFVDNSA